METSTNQESEIDKKKLKNLPEAQNWKDFFIDVASWFIMLIIIFIVGSRFVYACKVAQSNILPTNINCYPYTDTPPIFEKEPEVSIDIIKIYDGVAKEYQAYSTKLIFPVDDTEKTLGHYVINKLNTISKQHNCSRITMYVVDVLKNLFSSNYSAISFIFNTLNSVFSESFIILIPLILYYFLYSFLATTYFISFVLCTILFIVCAGRLFQYNTNNDSDSFSDKNSPPEWKKAGWISSFFSVIFAFFIYYPFAFIFSIPIFLFCLVDSLMDRNGHIVGDDNKKTYTFWNSIKGVITTKLPFFMTLFCIYTTVATYKYVNHVAAVFVFIASAIFLYKTNQSIPSLASPNIVPTLQCVKTCPTIPEIPVTIPSENFTFTPNKPTASSNNPITPKSTFSSNRPTPTSITPNRPTPNSITPNRPTPNSITPNRPTSTPITPNRTPPTSIRPISETVPKKYTLSSIQNYPTQRTENRAQLGGENISLEQKIKNLRTSLKNRK